MRTTGWPWKIVLSVCLLAAVPGYATDAPTTTTAVPHIFVPGQIVSADLLNENFAAIKPDLAETLIGVWATQCWDGYTTDPAIPATGMLTITSLTNVSYTGTSCLAGMGGGPSYVQGSPSITSVTALGNQAVFVGTYNNMSASHAYLVQRLEPGYIMITTNYDGVELWTRLDGPPENPRNLTASTAGAVVSLAWTDRSSDETSFRIMRRDSLDGSFAAVGSAAANATSASDTVTAAGTYWYRVQAVGANGTSLGTNIIKVTIE